MRDIKADNSLSGGKVERGLLIRDLPEDERPRDRLLQHGGQSLSDTEIIWQEHPLEFNCHGIVADEDTVHYLCDGILWRARK